jgi:hypothetical protein
MIKPQKLFMLFTVIAMFLIGCQRQNPGNQVNTQSAPPGYTQPNTNHPSVIPSASGYKTQTTNEHRSTTNGLGTSVYSLIGSSSLHSDGFSSHLESRLNGEGIDGVKVFVFDDTVILATEKRQPTAAQLDPVQQKVLSPTGGQSGRGPEPNRDVGTYGSDKTGTDNLTQAEQRIKGIMGGNVKVLTATGAKAVETINRVRANAASDVSSQSVSDDLRMLFKMTSDQAK